MSTWPDKTIDAKTARLRFPKVVLAGIIFCAAMAFLFGRFTGFEPHWRAVKDGMTQAEVTLALGSPIWTGYGEATGAGDKRVTRWEYRRSYLGGYVHYYVDFDYIGPGGIPAVFRTERRVESWGWPQWWPFQPGKSRA
jgi:hypothetical protein